MELFLTSRKRCDFPFNQDFEPIDMPVSTVNIALGMAEEEKKKPIHLLGNEPALHPELEQILSQCQKHGIATVMETCGLFSDAAKQTILTHRPILAWRIFRPECYTQETLEESRQNLNEFLKARLQIQFILIMDDPNADYSFIETYLDIFEHCLLLLRTNCMLSINEMKTLIKNHAELIKKLTLGGKDIVFDCHFLPCTFDDATFGMIHKLGLHMVGCSPHLMVMPNGQMAHCRPMSIVPGPHITSFKSQDRLLKYYYDVFRQMQVSVHENAPCSRCFTRHVNLCTGFNMAAKATELLKAREQLKPLFDNDEYAEGDKHMKLLWDMATIAIRLGFHNDVVECLEEMRRLNPQDPKVHFWLAASYWELDRKGDAEEEYRKSSRLSSNPIPALVELHRRFLDNGNTIRAHMLMEEIKKLAATQQQTNDQQRTK